MSKVKYRVREFTPKANQTGSHSFYAEVVINNDLDNNELAKRVAARTSFKSYECQAIVAAICEIIHEEVRESNRINLSTEDGTKMLSIYPKVNGSVSDLDIQRETSAAHAIDSSIPIRNKAEESDLTPDRLKFVLGATVGIKFSKQFALNKQAQKVRVVSTDAYVPNDDDPGNGNGGGNGGSDPDENHLG